MAIGCDRLKRFNRYVPARLTAVAMNHPTENPTPAPADPLAPYDGGWHCSHLWYSFDRERLNALAPTQREAIARDLKAVLHPAAEHAPLRMQLSITSGHKADFG